MGDVVVAERKGTQGASPAKQVEEHDWLEEWEDDEDISWGVLEQDQDHQEEEENANNQFVVTNYSISGRNIAIKQQPQLGIAHQVWHACLVLTDFFEAEEHFPTIDGRDWWNGKSVIELGAGTGIPGIFLACKGANVTLTDLPEVMDLLNANIQNNKDLFLKFSGRCRAAPLSWGEEHSHIERPIDVIIASDVVYWEHNFAPLIKTLTDLASEDTTVFMSWQKRRKGDKYFFKMAAKHFTITEITIKPRDAEHIVEKKLKKTHLLKLRKK